MFAADLADPAAYEIAEQGIRDDADGRTRVIWRAPDATSPPLYPEGTARPARTAKLTRHPRRDRSGPA